MSEYKKGMELTLTPVHENTGAADSASSDYTEIHVPAWLQHMLKPGDVVAFDAPLGQHGPMRWSVNGKIVTEPKEGR